MTKADVPMPTRKMPTFDPWCLNLEHLKPL